MGELIPIDPLDSASFDAPVCSSCGTVLRDDENHTCARCLAELS